MLDKTNKILIVDDDRNFNLMLSTRLQRKDFEVVQAYSGKEGFQKTKQQEPDLVITDLGLPDTNGLELLHELAANKIKTRVIVLSGYDLSPDKLQQAKSEGACDYIVKSEKVGDILKKIETAFSSDKNYNI